MRGAGSIFLIRAKKTASNLADGRFCFSYLRNLTKTMTRDEGTATDFSKKISKYFAQKKKDRCHPRALGKDRRDRIRENF